MSGPTCRELLDEIRDERERTANPVEALTLADRVERVLVLHEQAPYLVHPPTDPRCNHCWNPWPCPTVRLLDGEES